MAQNRTPSDIGSILEARNPGADSGSMPRRRRKRPTRAERSKASTHQRNLDSIARWLVSDKD